ncbi:MAG TPA: glycosyltransferase family 9 protein [Gemmatimonadaceae bacterium]|jgi:ADP-heptose:LPS heptosyltransferase
MRFIEELARRALFTALMRRTRRQENVRADDLPARGRRVLFIAEDAIGDTILTLPAIRAIATAHPYNEVDVVTWPTAAQLFENVHYVRDVITFPRYDTRRAAAMRIIRDHGPYDAVVDGMVLRRHVRSRSLAMMLGSGAEYWVGEGDRGSDYVFNVTTPRPSETTTHLDRMLALAAPFGFQAASMRPVLAVRPSERAGARWTWEGDASAMRVLINISTNGPERRWSPMNFAAVAAHLRRRRPMARIVVAAMEHDRYTAEYVASAADGRAIVPNLRELIALVESADLVVSPDTAVCHMASAFRSRLVSLHNAGKEAWHPFETPGLRVISRSPESLDSISAREVAQAVDQVLNQLVLNTSFSTDAIPLAAASSM